MEEGEEKKKRTEKGKGLELYDCRLRVSKAAVGNVRVCGRGDCGGLYRRRHEAYVYRSRRQRRHEAVWAGGWGWEGGLLRVISAAGLPAYVFIN